MWATDVSDIPMAKGVLYLVAILDCTTRRVPAWRLSNAPPTDFCAAALEEAIARYGAPAIFNTDRGCQLTTESSPACSSTTASAAANRGACREVEKSGD